MRIQFKIVNLPPACYSLEQKFNESMSSFKTGFLSTIQDLVLI